MKVVPIIFCLVIFLMFPVTSSADFTVERTSVIKEDTDIWSPAWGPDGESIAYVAYDESRNQQVFTIGIDGSGKKRITDNAARKWGVAWLEGGITYLSYDTDGLQKIFITQPDGTGTRKLLDEKMRQGKEDNDYPPVFGEVSENRVTGKILFTSYDENNNEKIYEINIDGTGKKQVIDDDKRQWDPDWNPDGTSFAYVSYDDSNNIQLFTANANGTGKKQITFDDVKKHDPNWGHDGILFVSFEDRFASGEKLYIINPDGTGMKPAIEDGFKQKNPRWNNDGTKILYEDIDLAGNKQIKILYLQKPEVIQTPVVTPDVTADVSVTPGDVEQTPSGEEELPEEDAGNNLMEILFTMFLVITVIILAMMAILLVSDLFSKK